MGFCKNTEVGSCLIQQHWVWGLGVNYPRLPDWAMLFIYDRCQEPSPLFFSSVCQDALETLEKNVPN